MKKDKKKMQYTLQVGEFAKAEKFAIDFTTNMTRTVLLQQLVEQLEELERSIEESSSKSERFIAQTLLEQVEEQLMFLTSEESVFGEEQ